MTDDGAQRSEVVVIGGGPGGYAAAFRAADLGLDVTLVSDEQRLGGVCLLRGCIPSKALLEATEFLLRTDDARSWGFDFADADVDLDRLRDWTSEIVDQLVSGLERVADGRGVTVMQGRATFTGADELRLTADDDTATLGFEHAIIATGSRPIALPGTSFDDRIIDSARALDLPDVPDRLLVVGGGYVGLELGTVYAALGSAVTLVEMTERLLPRVDQDLVEPLADQVRERFAGVHLETTVTELDPSGDEVRAVFDSHTAPDEQSFDRVLVAIGRRPNTDDLGLDATDVRVDDDGFIVTDEQRRTGANHVFAIGDAAGGTLLAHEAMHEGQVAAEAIAGQPSAFDVRAVPAVVYTDPQIAWCGLTERDAANAGRKVEVTRFPWRAAGRALTMEAADGMTKLVTDPQTHRVVGVGIVGRGAESLIGEGVLAVEMGAVADDLARSIAAHPTLSETLHEAADLLLGHPIHLPPP